VLTVELGERDAVGVVGDEQVEYGPHERDAAGLAEEPADHPGSCVGLAYRSLQQISAPLAPAVSGRAAQVHHERDQIVAEALGRGGVSVLLELIY
jgi:hypothetical protein